MPVLPLRFAAIMAVAAVAAGAAAAADGQRAIDLGVGQATVLHLAGPAKDVVVGNPAVADVSVENATTVVVFGRKAGGTTLMVLDGRGLPLVQAEVLVGAGGPDSVAVTIASGKEVKQQGGALTSWACGDFTCVRSDEEAGSKSSAGSGSSSAAAGGTGGDAAAAGTP